MLTQDRALYWLDRWDRQQEYYVTGREERFGLICEVVDETINREDPLIVDLGVGPGSLSMRLLERFPKARIVGVDADPLLLGLASAAYANDSFRVVSADLRENDWFDRLGLDRVPDAYVSTTALHWMNRQPLTRMIATCGSRIADGGVFVNGDHLYDLERAPQVDVLNKRLTALQLARGGNDTHEDWRDWWNAVESAPELAALVEQRAGGFDHEITARPSVHDYLQALRDGGFSEVGQVWQYGDDRIIVGLK